MQRRNFLSKLGHVAGAAAVTSVFSSAIFEKVHAQTRRTAHLSPKAVADDELFWAEIQQAFTITRGVINLDNGWVSPSPKVVTESVIRNLWELESNPIDMLGYSEYFQVPTIRARLSRMFGC